MNKFKNNCSCCCECNKKWEEKRPTSHSCGCQHDNYEKNQCNCELNCWFDYGNSGYDNQQNNCGCNNFYSQGY